MHVKHAATETDLKLPLSRAQLLARVGEGGGQLARAPFREETSFCKTLTHTSPLANRSIIWAARRKLGTPYLNQFVPY